MKPQLLGPIPGPRSRELRAREDATLAPGLQGFALRSGIAVSHASGSQVTDVDGNTYIDLIGGIGVNGLGHSHPKYVQAVRDQLDRVSVGSFTSEARVSLLERLRAKASRVGLACAQLYSSGAEAVESALRLAKCYTGKHEFVSFWGGFHGKTQGALSLMGSSFKNQLGPMQPGSHQIPYADCYRCPLALRYPSCGLACVELGRKHLKRASAGAIAAVVVEPMQGTAGNIVPPPEFIQAVAGLAREHDALLIADEMITGFGRTGRYWGLEHSGARPDILTVGKQFGGGFPISAVITRPEIAAARPWSNPSGSSSSYGGNPLGSAAADAAIRIIDEEGLVENSARIGARMLERLQTFEDRYAVVGTVRGAGLFLGIDFVADRAIREPLAPRECQRIFDACLQRGLLTMAYAPAFRMQPAMTLDTATADAALDILESVLHDYQRGRI